MDETGNIVATTDGISVGFFEDSRVKISPGDVLFKGRLLMEGATVDANVGCMNGCRSGCIEG